MDYAELLNQATQALLSQVPRIAGALAVLVIGWVAIKLFMGFLGRRLKKSSFDPSLRGFATGLLGALLKVMLLISVIGMLGVQMTSFIAVLGGLALAVGLSLQGSLANFAGGVLILARKPFKVGEFITGAGVSGTAEEINILYTRLRTPDGQVVFVPNGKLSNSEITNFSRNDTRRINLEVGIGYGDDIDHAKKVMKAVFAKEKRLLSEPAHSFTVSELGDSAVTIRGRAWVNNADYWGAYLDLMESVKKTFDKEGISIPYPQRDVHLHK
jgi:small conductance mechanosensitive channel